MLTVSHWKSEHLPFAGMFSAVSVKNRNCVANMAMRIDHQQDQSVRVISVLTPACGSVQLTRYQGSQAGLVEVGVAETGWFEIGKSGVKRVCDEALALEHRYELKRLARGLWRLTRFHPPGDPPYVPCQVEYVQTQVDYEASLSAAYGQAIETSYANADHCSWTWYTGTKEQLICSGLAVPSMFPKRGVSAKVRKSSSLEQGEWTANRLPDGRWRICYTHNKFEITAELQKEISLARLYEALRHYFGDDVDRKKQLR